MTESEVSPVSFRVHVLRLPKRGMPVAIEANDEQRTALAREHGLLDVKDFHADLMVTTWKGDGVRVEGVVRARIVQECVVTLEPVESLIDERVEGLFIPTGSRLAHPRDPSGELVIDADAPDVPEEFSGDRIDVGQLAEEFFALAIDPYPRAQGVPPPLPGAQDDDETARRSPFAKLAALKRQQ